MTATARRPGSNPRIAPAWASPAAPTPRSAPRPAARRQRVAAAPAARPARTPAAFLRRLESPERLVPVLVAAFLLVASVTAVPGLAGGATGATEGAGVAPRLVVGGDSRPRRGCRPSTWTRTSTARMTAPGPIPGLGFDETAGSVALGQESTDGRPRTWPASSSTTGRCSSRSWSTRRSRTGATSSGRYKVRSGDTLTGIASRTGVSMMTIWWANKLKSKDDLKIGQVLVIPPVDGLVVTVKAGDTLDVGRRRREGGARPTSSRPTRLTDDTLVIGQVLIIPGARGEPIPTPKPTRRPVVQVATVSRPSADGRTHSAPARRVHRRRVRLAGRRRVHQPVLPRRPPRARHRRGLRDRRPAPPRPGR